MARRRNNTDSKKSTVMVSGMNPERKPCVTVRTRAQGTRNTGRLRMHWIDTVKNDRKRFKDE